MPRETKATRYARIEQKIRQGLKAAHSDPKYNMLKESEEIYDAAELLVEAQVQFSENKMTEEVVRGCYKTFIGLHEVPPPAQSSLGLDMGTHSERE